MLWIDAICINQQDLKEKGHQVRNMGRIYKQASSVLIFLGPGEGDDSAVMKRQVSMFSDLLLEPYSRGLALREALDLPLRPDLEAQFSTHDFAASEENLEPTLLGQNMGHTRSRSGCQSDVDVRIRRN